MLRAPFTQVNRPNPQPALARGIVMDGCDR